jgi:hypothetical protein
MEKVSSMADQWNEAHTADGDQVWLALLRESLDEVDRVPTSVFEAGYAAFSWRTIDAELAHLTYDSSSAEALAGVRSQQAALRAMTFASNSFTIELQVEPTMLLGQVIPAAEAGTLFVTMRDGTSFGVPFDELGCFTIDPTPPGAFRLQFPGEASVVTDWITL